ncbi:MAG: hypothetical protein QM803_00970 [Rhodocyclaceae bacterium]
MATKTVTTVSNVLAANTLSKLHTVTGGTWALASLRLTNDGAAAAISAYIGAGNAPEGRHRIIATNTPLGAGGSYSDTNLLLAANESLWVRTTGANVAVRAVVIEEEQE